MVQKWPNLIAVYKFFANNFGLVNYNNMKFVDKMDHIGS